MDLPSRALSPEYVSFAELYHRNKIANSYLDIKKWKALSYNIDKFNPDVIIFIANKMLRIYQVLKFVDNSLFNAPLIISNFAIDYLEPKDLDGKKIAIVDATLNTGTILKNIEQKINHKFHNTQIKFFAVYQSENKHEIEAILVDKKILCIDDYLIIENLLSSSLNCLPEPVETEYPIFRVNVPKLFDYLGFGEDLMNANQNLQGIRLDSYDYFSVGIDKFSFDVFPGRGVNDKWRFYLDDAKHILTFVPMAHYDPDTNSKDDKYNRLNFYINSLAWGKKCWSYIQSISKLPDITLDKCEVELLFGHTYAKKILSIYNTLPSKCESLEPLPCKEQTLYFYNAYKNLDENLKLKNTADCKLFFDYFTKFFINLVNLVGEDCSSEYKFNDNDYVPNLNQVNENNYLRLCVGPTFTELLHLMKYYFDDKKIDITNKNLHILIDKTLDRQIDQGFIIPTFDCYGRLIFRRGNTIPYNLYEMKAANFVGLKPTFSNVREMMNSLPDDKRKDLFDSLSLFEIYGDDYDFDKDDES